MGRPKGSKDKHQKSLTERFWEKVNVQGDNDCWEWEAYIHPSGYGNISWCGRMWGAHKISWILHFGDVPDGLYVSHICDNRICVNPNHLFLGTHQDNMKDRDVKRRGKIPNNVGSNHGMSKLKEEDVLKIKNFLETTICDRNELAKDFNVSVTTIYDIERGQSWKHLQNGVHGDGSH